jgi:uncharacterized protein YecT (DUF1311 family)
MRSVQIFLIATLVSFACPSARATDAPAQKDVATLTSCLDAPVKGPTGQEIDEARCLNKIAAPCIGDPGSARDASQVACYDRERLVWDKILNDSYRTMVGGLDPDQAGKLREMQRAWIQVRDLTCGFWYEYFQGTMANPMIASCQNRETARRAIYLRVFAIDISGRK